MAMISCPTCDNQEYEGTLFCGECGTALMRLTAEVAVLDKPVSPKPPSLLGQQVGQAAMPENIVLMIPLSGRRLSLLLDRDIRVGRSMIGHDDPPELDTAVEHGSEHGVSRNHAIIRPSDQGVMLIDLNSTNGTTLNKYRLPPELPYPLKNGDEILFGSLLVHVFFR